MSAPDNTVQAARERMERAFLAWSATQAPQGTSRERDAFFEGVATAERDRDAALKSASDGWRAAGEAQGKLEVSETAGVVEGWRRRAEEAERERDEALAVIDGLEIGAYPAHGSGFVAIVTGGGAALQALQARRAAALTAAAEGTGDQAPPVCAETEGGAR